MLTAIYATKMCKECHVDLKMWDEERKIACEICKGQFNKDNIYYCAICRA
jgi:hypothetical protein